MTLLRDEADRDQRTWRLIVRMRMRNQSRMISKLLAWAIIGSHEGRKTEEDEEVLGIGLGCERNENFHFEGLRELEACVGPGPVYPQIIFLALSLLCGVSPGADLLAMIPGLSC